jgi:transposase InsO family protein
METSAVNERMRLVAEFLKGDLTKVELAERFGVSRPTVDKWIGRFERLGVDGLKDLSRAPGCHPNQIDAHICQRILGFRQQHRTWGPRKLRAALLRLDDQADWPACSTIGDILGRGGLSGRRKRRRRAPAYTEPFRECTAPNDVWCVDYKGCFWTGDGSRCDPLTLTDAASRYLLACRVMKSTGLADAQLVMERAFKEYGLPRAIRSDNGSPFASRGVQGLTRLSLWWVKLGITPERIQPGCPQENGRHERFHLTLKQETASPPLGTLTSQQRRFDSFRREYNTQRPHEALGQQPPASVYVQSLRAYKPPPKLAEYPEGTVVRNVQNRGEFYWRSAAIFLGEALAGERIALRQLDERYWKVCFMHLELGLLDEKQRRMVSSRQEAVVRAFLEPCVPSAALQARKAPGET